MYLSMLSMSRYIWNCSVMNWICLSRFSWARGSLTIWMAARNDQTPSTRDRSTDSK